MGRIIVGKKYKREPVVFCKDNKKTIETWMIIAGKTESTVCVRRGWFAYLHSYYQELTFSDNE